MRERPIIFSAEMVRAILAKKKTQTRRVMKPQPANGCHYVITDSRHGACHLHTESFNAKQFDRCYVPPRPNFASHILPCPYGKPGDRLWVREAWNFISDEIIVPVYRADDEAQTDKWRSPIFMPREASRITLEITNVRVEQLHEIKAIEVISEGVQFEQHTEFENGGLTPCDEIRAWQAFSDGWNNLNAKRGFSWDSNPWVWVIEFKKL